ncbi:VOC family protein [Phaeobacter porticola]|uniref:Glyoxalase-like protein n=1 Tax=Phaeobacter porticola TaxID=1844006 RepID=A0A1L3I964_9RHOB|nr:VOC family protein [Phaeobacter porticola]APG48573.1 glyoxalase-like protein [Phaeobacter porticola]
MTKPEPTRARKPSITTELTGIYETHLPVRDLAVAMAFYETTIGLKLAHYLPERDVAFYWVGGHESGMLGLWSGGSAPMGMRLHMAFRSTVTAMDGVCDRLCDAGVVPLDFHGAPTDQPVVLGWMPALSIYFNDPDGHSIEILAPLAEQPDPGFGVDSYNAWLARIDS